MDSLTFGARRFLRHVTDLSYKKSPVTEFEVSKVTYTFYLIPFPSEYHGYSSLFYRFWWNLDSQWISSSTYVSLVDATTARILEVLLLHMFS